MDGVILKFMLFLNALFFSHSICNWYYIQVLYCTYPFLGLLGRTYGVCRY